MIGQIRYQATWIYNKGVFLSKLLESMKAERADLISEIREQDKKLAVISKPFGGYRNIVEIDDIHFEDGFLSPEHKQRLAVSDREQKLNV